MREHDLEIARINIAGDLTDLIASGRIPEIDVVAAVDDVVGRYRELWEELTRSEEFPSSERHLIESRIRRLEDLGFDVSEVSLRPTQGGSAIRMRPVLLEEGHHARELEQLTGLRVQENQARRFLADITQSIDGASSDDERRGGEEGANKTGAGEATDPTMKYFIPASEPALDSFMNATRTYVEKEASSNPMKSTKRSCAKATTDIPSPQVNIKM